VTEALVLALGYLLGSIPFGYLAGRLRGVDIRVEGSRNTGATNVFRTLGRGIGVMVADIGKGLAAVLIARVLLDDPWPLAVAAFAVAGHVFPVWLRFRGGKGVAVAAGALIGVMPLVSATLVVIWIAIVLITRYVSLASVVCALALPLLAWAFGLDWPKLVLAGLVALAVLLRHRANLQRLARGQELRIELRRPRRA
jgi:acyl phosphate:glycerol-3-phosphate acyltransferase